MKPWHMTLHKQATASKLRYVAPGRQGGQRCQGGWFCTHPMNLAVNSMSFYDIPAFVRINTLSHHVMHTYYDLVRYQKLLHHCSKENC